MNMWTELQTPSSARVVVAIEGGDLIKIVPNSSKNHLLKTPTKYEKN